MDKRRHYVLIIDTETAGTLDAPLVYDIGYTVTDTRGNVYDSGSFTVNEIYGDAELMNGAFYSEKAKKYSPATHKSADFFEIQNLLCLVMDYFGIKEACMHNTRFDLTALNNTARYISDGAEQYFFPYGLKLWDTMRMARNVILKKPTYKKFVDANGLRTPKNLLPYNAQALYAYITQNPGFEEAHTAKEDTLIEAAILAYCIRQHKAMAKNAFGPKEVIAWNSWNR